MPKVLLTEQGVSRDEGIQLSAPEDLSSRLQVCGVTCSLLLQARHA